MYTITWQEVQSDGADYKEYSAACGHPDSLFQIYWMLRTTKRKWRVRITSHGREVIPTDKNNPPNEFAWFFSLE